MATEAQIQANLANARKSTGPRTAAGKARSRLNALKHGLRGAESPTVLPQEDPAELQGRIQEWLDDYQPMTAVERELVTRGARISWSLDRADRHEAALLSRRVRKAMLRTRSKRTAKVCALGRKLLHMAGKRPSPGSGPEWADDPAVFVAGLEESLEGAQWLRDRWLEIGCLIDAAPPWTFLDRFKFVRLLGKQPFDAIVDPELNAIFLAWEAIEPGSGLAFWKKAQESTSYEDPAYSAWGLWRELVPRPVDAETAVALIREIADREVDRLEALLDDLDAVDGDDAAELAEQASFLVGDAGERLRRFQSTRTRELIRIVETLAKLRKENAAAADEPTSEKSSNEPNPIPAQSSVEHHVTSKLDEFVERDRSRSLPGVAARPWGAEGEKRGPRERGGRPSGLRGQVETKAAARLRPASSASRSAGSRRATGSPG